MPVWWVLLAVHLGCGFRSARVGLRERRCCHSGRSPALGGAPGVCCQLLKAAAGHGKARAMVSGSWYW